MHFLKTPVLLLLRIGNPVKPPVPFFTQFNITDLLSVQLPWEHFNKHNDPVDHFVVMYRRVLGPGHFGPYHQEVGQVGQDHLDLWKALPNSRYEVVQVAVNEAGSSPASLSQFIVTPEVCKFRHAFVLCVHCFGLSVWSKDSNDRSTSKCTIIYCVLSGKNDTPMKRLEQCLRLCVILLSVIVADRLWPKCLCLDCASVVVFPFLCREVV